MKISAFTMVRNATKYYFPIKESISSILPIVDEFIVALGNDDQNDHTRKEIESIDSDKIRIIDRIWSEQDFIESRIFALETNFALQQCAGDWCIYLQADEVIHENDLNAIKAACSDQLTNTDIDGFLFDYYHFFGDYDHYLPVHGWYKNEIRVVRNNAGVYSYKDAQSFRKNKDQKLNVLPIAAHIYHYGWVRPPSKMQSKKKEHDSIHHGKEKIEEAYKSRPNEFNYGALGKIPVFKGEHPKVMDVFRSKIEWKDKLNYTKKSVINRDKMKHEKFKYRLLTFIENTLNGGRDIIGYSNWKIVTISSKKYTPQK
jgi:glycosyltransferase involved in cell wall biosynthesis